MGFFKSRDKCLSVVTAHTARYCLQFRAGTVLIWRQYSDLNTFVKAICNSLVPSMAWTKLQRSCDHITLFTWHLYIWILSQDYLVHSVPPPNQPWRSTEWHGIAPHFPLVLMSRAINQQHIFFWKNKLQGFRLLIDRIYEKKMIYIVVISNGYW